MQVGHAIASHALQHTLPDAIACLPLASTGKHKSSKTHILAVVPANELPASLKAVLNADEKKEAPLAVVRKEDQIYEKEFEMEMERAKVRLLLTGKQLVNDCPGVWPAQPMLCYFVLITIVAFKSHGFLQVRLSLPMYVKLAR